ncbi:hypothetical protein FRC09_000045 [Ceratobasidium sp. 395]|nr:hypothetical protein FRC09_000045 [Ceratobasidium sp. 395]
MSAQSTLDGATLVERVTRPGSVGSGPAEPNPLDDVTIKDGFYQLLQEVAGKQLNVALNPSAPFKPYEIALPMYPLKLNDNPQLTEHTFVFTRQWGVHNGFTITPKDTPGDPNPAFGCDIRLMGDLVKKPHGDTPGQSQTVIGAFREASYSPWTVRCDESRTYRQQDGSTKTLYYFRILNTIDLGWPDEETAWAPLDYQEHSVRRIMMHWMLN